MIATALIGLVTSFVGSMASFVLWVHFDLDDKYEEWKYRRHVEKNHE